MILTSFGAAGEVTGSKHLLNIDNKRILLDCGMFQGHRQEADEKNRHFGFEPYDVHAVVLSHAHIDHSGLLPMLCKQGYGGPIYATPATRDLCAIMLLDSAHIQQRDSEWLSKKNMQFIPPLYSLEDVQAVMRRFISVPLDMRFPLLDGVFLTFHEAGHVLGSAMVEIEYEENSKMRRFIFSGDIGRKNMPILADPWEPTEADVVLMESTYGDRDHGPMQEMEHKFAEIINRTYERGGKIIIPSFALERAQEVIYALKNLEMNGAIPEDIRVFVDSPLTVNITEIFRLHTEAFDKDFRESMRTGGDPFHLNHIRYVRNVEESIALNSMSGPAIIIAASGMCEYGRVVHHIRNTCEDPKNTILIVGFQASHTLGRRIVERERYIKILGIKRELNAEVAVMNEFSAHAGRTELLDFGARFKDTAEQVILVHGEKQSQAALKKGLEERGVQNVSIAKRGESIVI